MAPVQGAAQARPSKLFIGGLTQNTTTKLLREHFSRYCRVLDCVAMRTPDGRSRGFGYVTLDSPEAAARVLGEPQVVDGREVEMKMAVPGNTANEKVPKAPAKQRGQKEGSKDKAEKGGRQWSGGNGWSKGSWQWKDDSAGSPWPSPPGLAPYGGGGGARAGMFPATTLSSSIWNSSWEGVGGAARAPMPAPAPAPAPPGLEPERKAGLRGRRPSSPSDASTRSSSGGAEGRRRQGFDQDFMVPCFADYDEVEEPVQTA